MFHILENMFLLYDTHIIKPSEKAFSYI